jgi:hypothetical protein
MRWPAFFLTVVPGLSAIAHRLRGRRRRRRRFEALMRYSCLGVLTAAALRATSVTPPSFPELVAEAQVIAQGTVTSISSRWVDGPQGRMIKTFVDFAVAKQLKGDPASTLTLEFLGGTVGPDTLRVSGMPEFKVGDSEIVFVRDNGVQFCPLVRLMHGRYRVHTDPASQRPFVARDDDIPLTSTADVQRPGDDHAAAMPHTMRSAGVGLTPDEFEAQIAAEVAHPTP